MSEKSKDANQILASRDINQALAAFLPSVVGALFGGPGGAAQGAALGQQVLKPFQEAELKREAQLAEIVAQESDLEKRQKFQREERKASEQFQLKLSAEKAKASLGKSEKLSESQAKARKFADAAEFAEGQYAKAIKETEFDPTGKSATAQTIGSMFLPKSVEPILQTEGFERTRQAEREFINSTLRDDSGAALKDDEIEEAQIRLFPRPGDSKGTVSQKKLARDLIVSTLKEKGKLITSSEARSLIGTKQEEALKPTAKISVMTNQQKQRLQELRLKAGK